MVIIIELTESISLITSKFREVDDPDRWCRFTGVFNDRLMDLIIKYIFEDVSLWVIDDYIYRSLRIQDETPVELIIIAVRKLIEYLCLQIDIQSKGMFRPTWSYTIDEHYSKLLIYDHKKVRLRRGYSYVYQ